VKVAASGLCHTDHEAASGRLGWPFPQVLGHEGAGVVESVGEGVTRVAPGDKVLLAYCQNCENCSLCSI